jgi:hypothetical protein
MENPLSVFQNCSLPLPAASVRLLEIKTHESVNTPNEWRGQLKPEVLLFKF